MKKLNWKDERETCNAKKFNQIHIKENVKRKYMNSIERAKQKLEVCCAEKADTVDLSSFCQFLVFI